MKKQIRILFLAFVLIITCLSAFGVIAYPYPVEITQPDGTKITIILRGDEHVKWAETVDGYSILRNSKGVYEYAIHDSKNDLVPSGIKVRNQSGRSSSDNQFLTNIRKGLSYSKSQVGLMKSISGIKEPGAEKAFPTTGSRKLVCILIGFTDAAFTKTKADLENLFNQVGYTTDGATGSVYDFYKENSFNQLDLSVTVAGPYTAANNMAYYGANDASGNDIRPRELVTEAVNLANPTVNYADFDNDGDGTVDGVYVIYAGYGEEYSGVSSDAIWAHAWSITPLTLDGKTVSRYSCSSELRGNSGAGLTRIGVICHEFGHVMGAADFYDTNYGTGGQFSGTGSWDLMASGNWNNSGTTPAHHNPYTKVYYYAWATATTLATTLNITLNNAEQNSNSFYRVNTATSNEFFLIENRQQHKFDTNIPGHGMIIYHVDGNYISSAGNQINAGSHQGMYPVCANATGNPPTTYGTINSSGLPFPGTGSRTSFTDETTPWAKSWAGAGTYLPVINITENNSNKTINFDFPGFDDTMPGNFSAMPAGTEQITLSWSKNSSNNNVMIVYSTSTVIGTPVNGTVYSVGNSIPGGGTVIYSGSATTCNHPGLTPGTRYYYKAWSIKTGNSYSTGVTTEAITSFSLPLTESFNTSVLPSGWTTQITGPDETELWSLSNTALAGGAAYELMCSYSTYGPFNEGTTRVISPAINTTGVSSITLSFKHFFDDYNSGVTLLIQSSTDKVTWINETWSSASGSGNLGPATINTTINSNLNSATTYIAFVITGDLFQFDNWYIDDVSFSGSAIGVPTLTTAAVTSVTYTTAVSGGNITADGGGAITARGVCWATTTNPTIANSKTTDGTGTGSFVSNLTGLEPGTTYYVRAYATNSAGTSYGNEVAFATSPAVVATLTTTTVTLISQTTAVSGGNITSDGGGAITVRGVCWATTANPTISNSKTSDGTGIGSFVSNLTGLLPGTTYHVRAYATNIAGTAYGNDVSFTTGQVVVPTLTTTAVTSITQTTAVSGGNIVNNGGGAVTVRGVCWATTANPTLSNSKTIDGTGNGSFVSSLTGLLSGTTYHVRAYATNSAGTAYGNDLPFTTTAGAHFVPVWSGAGMDHMNLYALTAKLDNIDLQPGDEIGIFDGSACVGMGTLTQVLTGSVYLSMVVSKDDPDTPVKDGYTAGNTISFKVWDSSAGSEVSNAQAAYVSGTGIFSVGGTAAFNLNAITSITQDISLTAGWNIMSFAGEPDNMSLSSIVNSLKIAGTLVKIQDEKGSAIEQLPAPIGWVDNIGLMKVSEGYKIKVSANTTLSVTGKPVTLPYTIDLSNGWNIMGYPSMNSQSAMAAFHALINAGTLLKVQDEKGNAIEQLPAPIGWVDNIHTLAAGEGYKVKVSSATSITINNSGKGEYQNAEFVTLIKPSHFKSAYTGNGFDHMNIYLKEATIGGAGIKSGDEIGVFDGGVCVGAVVVEDPNSEYIMMTASLDDPTTKETDGFIAGHNFTLKLWDRQSGIERNTQNLQFEKGSGKLFERLGTSVLAVDFETKAYTSLGDAYPNPSTDKTTFTFQLAGESKVRLEIYNMKGDLIKVLVDDSMPGGMHQIIWDNRSASGTSVSSGIYFYRLILNNFMQTKQLVIR